MQVLLFKVTRAKEQKLLYKTYAMPMIILLFSYIDN